MFRLLSRCLERIGHCGALRRRGYPVSSTFGPSVRLACGLPREGAFIAVLVHSSVPTLAMARGAVSAVTELCFYFVAHELSDSFDPRLVLEDRVTGFAAEVSGSTWGMCKLMYVFHWTGIPNLPGATRIMDLIQQRSRNTLPQLRPEAGGRNQR